MNDSVPLIEDTAQLVAARKSWRYRGDSRPDFALTPDVHQESVWDYPRPPQLQSCKQLLEVRHQNNILASTQNGVRVLETAGAPTYYFPPGDVLVDLIGDGGSSICEWKGRAQGLSITGIHNAAWRYVRMFPAYRDLYLWVSFYPAILDCYVDDELATPQPGGYYGGWVTANIVGPIKGEPGSQGW